MAEQPEPASQEVEKVEVAEATETVSAPAADAPAAEASADAPAQDEVADTEEMTVTAAGAADETAAAEPASDVAAPVAEGASLSETAAAAPAEPEEAASPEAYDPSVPVGFDPLPTADGGEGYDPSEPQEYDPSVPVGYDPSVPVGYDASEPVEYDPSMPAGESMAVEAEMTEPEPSALASAPIAVDAAPLVEEAAPVNGSSAPYEQQALPPAATEAYYPDVEAELKEPIPEGLTEESPSVASNRDLVRQWRQHPEDSTLSLSLFNWAVQKTEIADARVWYKILGLTDPTAWQPLLALINLELAFSNFSQVEELFATALRSSSTLMAAPDVNIWKAYLHYIRRQNPAETPEARATVTQAYEFALKECGIDREAGEIWQEYIAYLGEVKSKNPWDLQQQADTLRKVYQRAVAIPLNNVEALWKAYDAFESQQNKQTAKKFLADRSPPYMTARTALREMRALTDILPHPIVPPEPNYSNEDRQIVGAWRAYLKWEENNPLAADDDTGLVAERVGYALRKCMGQMRHFPELWHYAATYHLTAGRTDEGLEFLKAGVTACPKSFLLSFALAEQEEERKNVADCHSIFEKLLASLNKEIDELKVTVAAEVEAARGPEIPIAPSSDMDMNGEESDVARLVREREERGKMVQERRSKDIDEVKTAAGIVWVMYMGFARRSEGLKAARLVFGKARKSPHVTWYSFEAAALMEYHSNKDSSVAVRIFELGLKQFSEDVDYVTKYLEFLLSINDDTNARALFERSALKIAADKARPLWETWARFEYMYGDLTAVHKLEARFAETFPGDSPLKRFAQRYTYDGIDEIARRDLGFAKRAAQAARRPAPIMQVGAPPALPPFPPSVAMAARAGTPPRSSPQQKRDRSPPRSPARADFKRQRGASPIPPPRQPFPSVGGPAGRFGPSGGRSPVPGVVPGRTVVPPRAVPPPAAPTPPPVPAYQQYERSGLPKPLNWFVGTLPPARSFDGPVFRAEDVMRLFSNIGPTGQAVAGATGGGYGGNSPVPRMGGAPRPPARQAYPDQGYGGGRGQMRGRY